MRSTRRYRYVALAALAVSGASVTFAQQPNDPIDAARAGSAAPDNRANADRHDRTTNLPGRSLNNPSAVPNDPDTRAISQVIGNVVQAGLSDEPRQIAQYFSKADRQRLEPKNDPNATPRDPKLDQAMADLKHSYRERYGQGLALTDSGKLFGPDLLRISAEPGDSARTAAAQRGPSGNNPAGSSGDPVGKAVGTGDTTTVSRKAADADNSTNGRTVTLPAGHGMPEVTLNLVKEGPDWRIDVPDSLTPQQLQANLARHLSMANAAKDQWPKDAADAQRVLGHHVLAAITKAAAEDQRQ